MITDVTAVNVSRHANPLSIDGYSREQGLWPIERRLIAEFVPSAPARILDVGCGSGRTTIGLTRAGYDSIAIDLSDAMLATARARFPALTFRRMDATALEFAPATFDAALFSYNGIDYIYPEEARCRCMREILRVLRTGGVFIMSSHNAIGHLFSGGFWYVPGYVGAARILAHQWGNPYVRQWYFRYDDPGGDQFFFSAPPDRTVAQLQDAGFEILAVCGRSGERRLARIKHREPHVYFVARRPAI